ncbi:MAG: type-F conjugative transfer system secretin TraK [Candidatus Tisiphia sp.]
MKNVVNKLYLSFILPLWTILVLIVLPWQAYGASQFNYSGDDRIEASIAASSLNRIGVVGGEIVEVIGDENKYAIYWSSDWRNLFIKPKVEVGETISLSLIMPGGFAQDIRFTVLDMASQTILLNLHNKGIRSSLTTNKIVPYFDQKLKSEMVLMMRAMIEGVQGKYYVMEAERTLRKTKQQLLKQIRWYRYGDLSGAVLLVKNLSSKPLLLLESDFSNLFTNTIAINLGSSALATGASTKAFIITKEVAYD